MRGIGGIAHEVDIEPLLEAARLLYEGPWVAERYLATESLLTQQPDAMLPVTRQIIEGGARPKRARGVSPPSTRCRHCAAPRQPLWRPPTCCCCPPQARTTASTRSKLRPSRLNSTLGHYTNFVNLMDLAAVAVPAGFTQRGLPFGVTLVAPAFNDEELLQLASRLHQAVAGRLGAMEQPLHASKRRSRRISPPSTSRFAART